MKLSKILMTDCHNDFLFLDKQSLIFTDLANKDKPIEAKVLVTRANSKNLNKRVYSKESLERIIKDNQEKVNLGLMIGYQEHPEEVYNKHRQLVGFNYNQNPPAFRVTKLWMDGDEAWANIQFLNNDIGRTYSKALLDGQDVFVSLRAGGSCVGDPNNVLFCDVEAWDGFDIVTRPATQGAKMWAAITDSEKPQLDSYVATKRAEAMVAFTDMAGFFKQNDMWGGAKTDAPFPPKPEEKPESKPEDKSGDNGGGSSTSSSSGNGGSGQPAPNAGQAGGSSSNAGNNNAPVPPDQSQQGMQGSPDAVLAEIMSWPPEAISQICQILMSMTGGGMGAMGGAMGMNPMMNPMAMSGMGGMGGGMGMGMMPMLASLSDTQKTELNSKLVQFLDSNAEKLKLGKYKSGVSPEKDNKSFDLLIKVIQNNSQSLFDSIKNNTTSVNKEGTMTTANKKLEALTDSELNNLLALAGNTNLQAIIDKAKRFDDFIAENEANKLKAENKKKVEKFVDDVFTKPEFEGFKFELLDEKQIEIIQTTAKSKDTEEAAKQSIIDNLKVTSQVSAYKQLQAKGFNPEYMKNGKPSVRAFLSHQAFTDATRFRGKTITGVQAGETGKGYQVTLDKLDQAITDYRMSNNPKHQEIVNEYKDVNKKFVDKIMAQSMEMYDEEAALIAAQEYQDTLAFKDMYISRAKLTKMIDDTPNLISSTQMKNQAFISNVWKRQVFQQLQSLEHMRGYGAEVLVPEFGKVIRIPSITRPDPFPGQPDPEDGFYIEQNDTVSEFDFKTSFQFFNSRYRQRAVRYNEETIITLLSGPLDFDVVAEGKTQLMDEMAIVIDTNGYMEMVMAIDEHNAIALDAFETVQDAEDTYQALGSVSMDGVTYAADVVYVAKLRCGETTGALTTKPWPIVRPRKKADLSTLGAQDSNIVINDITFDSPPVSLVGRRGKIGVDNSIQPVNGNSPLYAINWAKRHFIAKAGAGFDGSTRPSIKYTYATNWTTYLLTPNVGDDPREFYNGFLFQTNGIAQEISQAEKVRPDTVLGTDSTLGKFLPMANLFSQDQKIVDTALKAGYAKSNFLTEHAGLRYFKHNGIFPDGDGSCFMFAKGESTYTVTEPPSWSGPIQAMKLKTGTTDIVLIPAVKYTVKQMDMFATPRTLRDNGDGTYTAINVASKRIIFSGNVHYTKRAA